MPDPFYFAWVDPGTAFNPAVHNREDEQIISFAVEQVETEFATLSIEIKNPRVGFLNSGRKLWAWLGCLNEGVVIPLFFGRVDGIPSNLHKEVITLIFRARPTDYAVQKMVLAETLRVLPYYDPVFIKEDAQNDPDVVLEGRTQVWHVDRVDHSLSVSDLIVGEDGLLEFEESEVPYDSVAINLDQAPIRWTRVTADVSWSQVVSGDGLLVMKNKTVHTVAGAGLVGGWPKSGTLVGGGPSIGESRPYFIPGTSLGGGWHTTIAEARSPYTKMTDEDWGNWWTNRHFFSVTGGEDPRFPPMPFLVDLVSSFSVSLGGDGSSDSSSTRFAIVNDTVSLDLTIGYRATRQYRDTIVFDLISDSQPIVTMPDDAELLDLKITGNDLSGPIGGGDYAEVPHNNNRRSYFTTDRGRLSLQYLIQLARANIVLRSRAVKIAFVCTFERAIELSLRKNALLHDRRIPGGQALGKIVGYSIKSEGGRRYGEVTFACCIGYGGEIAPQNGTPTYIEDGYIDDDYYVRDGQLLVLAASDVGFVPLVENPNDDGLRFPLRAPVYYAPPLLVTTSEFPFPSEGVPSISSDQQNDDCGELTSANMSSTLDTSPFSEWLGGVNTSINFTLKSVTGGPFETTYYLDVTDLKLPNQINLEADAA